MGIAITYIVQPYPGHRTIPATRCQPGLEPPSHGRTREAWKISQASSSPPSPPHDTNHLELPHSYPSYCEIDKITDTLAQLCAVTTGKKRVGEISESSDHRPGMARGLH
jgi:hypothetical protein